MSSESCYCSSVAALGQTTDGTPADETTPVDRGATSSAPTSARNTWRNRPCWTWCASEGLPAVIVNPAAPVGPRDIKPTPTGR